MKLKDNSESGVTAMRDMLMSMKGKVDVIEDMNVGVDFLHSDRSWDVMLEVVLKDRAALDAYQADPYHHGTVKPYVQSARTAVAAIDFEI